MKLLQKRTVTFSFDVFAVVHGAFAYLILTWGWTGDGTPRLRAGIVRKGFGGGKILWGGRSDKLHLVVKSV